MSLRAFPRKDHALPSQLQPGFSARSSPCPGSLAGVPAPQPIGTEAYRFEPEVQAKWLNTMLPQNLESQHESSHTYHPLGSGSSERAS